MVVWTFIHFPLLDNFVCLVGDGFKCSSPLGHVTMVYTLGCGNMMLAWPGSEREASDDFVFVMTIRLIAHNYYNSNPSQNHHL